MTNNVAVSAAIESISITVTGIDTSRGGKILVLIYGPDGFPKNHAKAKYRAMKVATKPTLIFDFSVELANYAVKVLHDENETGEVTKNWSGMLPAEGLGFSNGAGLSLSGPPSFKQAMLPMSNAEFSIKLKYPRFSL